MFHRHRSRKESVTELKRNQHASCAPRRNSLEFYNSFTAWCYRVSNKSIGCIFSVQRGDLILRVNAVGNSAAWIDMWSVNSRLPVGSAKCRLELRHTPKQGVFRNISPAPRKGNRGRREFAQYQSIRARSPSRDN